MWRAVQLLLGGLPITWVISKWVQLTSSCWPWSWLLLFLLLLGFWSCWCRRALLHLLLSSSSRSCAWRRRCAVLRLASQLSVHCKAQPKQKYDKQVL